ncbi:MULTISPECIES: SdpI family protein [unclassified Nocardiopsis]|uniref:SdpI family protein n=1 Tax=unclassified Nocardiopsis TaxID=2649073 RepID=UPI001358F9A0|nr:MULTISPECIES: SdpI family protein [unclassified Nocardiopsis]
MDALVGLLAAVVGLAVVAGSTHYLRNATASGALERNALVGLRTSATMASDEGWREGHRAAGPWLTATVRLGYLAAAAAAVSALAGLSTALFLSLAWAVVAVAYPVLLGLLITGTVIAHRAAGDARRAGSR